MAKYANAESENANENGDGDGALALVTDLSGCEHGAHFVGSSGMRTGRPLPTCGVPALAGAGCEASRRSRGSAIDRANSSLC
jgi:hypothetical protein